MVRSKVFAAVLGLLSHYILNNGEYDHSSHIVLLGWIFSFGALVIVEYVVNPTIHSLFAAVQTTAVLAVIYFGTLISSIVIYRSFFHRLRKFDGPFGARVSKFYSVGRVIKSNCQYYNEVEAMHKQYKSDIVRTGPRELSIISTDAIAPVFGPLSKCSKTVFYNAQEHLEGLSVFTTRDKQEHRERRKLWDRAFSTKSLRDYEPRLNRYARLLISRLKEHSHESSLRLSNWVNFYSVDVMGDVGFNRSFEMLEKGQEDQLIQALHDSMAPASYLIQVIWISGILMRTFGAPPIVNFINWTAEVLRERKKITPAENDVIGWLFDPNDEDIPRNLNSDARILVVAGSDTTAASLTWLFYELCKNPSAQTKLRAIVDKIQPSKSFLDVNDVANCPHLDGVIHEAMRLHPAVPSGVSRETPPEGITLPDQTYIPGETLIVMPYHTMQRDERYFPSPLEYMPERWTDEKPEFIKDKRAFIPFGTGVYGCVGQKLALMEMRSVTANIVRNFKIEFGGSDKGERVVRETRDCFTSNVGPLDVKLTPRS